MFLANSVLAETLNKIVLNEENILLLDVAINNETIASSVDAYKEGENIVIAIEPLFDGLKLRYQIIGNQLKVWKEEQSFTFDFTEQLVQGDLASQNHPNIWAFDGIYQFISIDVLGKVFGLPFTVDIPQQKLIIASDKGATFDRVESPYLFPVQKLALQSERRQMNRFYNSNNNDEETTKSAITITDEYRLMTPPHGRVYANADLDQQRYNGSVQLVSDLLYHSANLTLSKSDDNDIASSLNFSRYKKSPDERILSLFDAYHFGDVSGVANNLTTESNSGLGIVFDRYPDGFRNNNLETTIEEIAPPGWDAELFHNGAFIAKVVVPGDGRLIFQNVRLYYGLNDFEIRLYGPFGEEEIIAERINVRQNPLSEGQVAYSLNALDKNNQVFNNSSNDPFQITNVGGSLSYGINDQWQIGLSFASIDNDKQFYSIKNNLSFNNFLFENDLSLNQDGSYAQLTTVTGSMFNKDNYSLIFESADNFESDVISAKNDSYYKLGANYSFPTDLVLARIGGSYQKNNEFELFEINNIFSKQFGVVNFTHGLTYNKVQWISEELGQVTGTNESLFGSLGVNTRFSGFLLSAFINYDPKADDPFLKDSSVSLRKNFKDPFNNRHNLQAQYYPLIENGVNWRLQHNVTWDSQAYQMTLSSSYDSSDDWNVQFGIHFFLGYDYYNNRVIIDKEFSGGTATLDVHSYLDRHVNGVPDVLDYNLENVSFAGHSRWENYKSNSDGKTILPGVYANSEFAFAAKWQEGSATVNQDYVVYTHPGAYINVNMPFYLITDLTGFVLRKQGTEEIPLRNVQLVLLNTDSEVVASGETDQDGYYEFLQLSPDKYRLQVKTEYLRDKGMTGEITGYDVITSGRGGFIELPSIYLGRLQSEGALEAEDHVQVILDDSNTDALVWDKDPQVTQNYFTLPRKGKGELVARYSLGQELPVEEQVQEAQVDEKQQVIPLAMLESQTEQSKPLNFNNTTVIKRVEGSNSILPKLSIRKLSSPQNQSLTNSSGDSDLARAKAAILPSGDLSQGWVLQMMSMVGIVDANEAKRNYSQIGQLYIGQKLNTQGVVLNCVISQIFNSREEALAALKIAGLNGWVTKSTTYNAIKKID